MNRITALRKAANYAQFYAESQEAIKNQTGAIHARTVRTELLNMADELETVPNDTDLDALIIDAANERAEHLDAGGEPGANDAQD